MRVAALVFASLALAGCGGRFSGFRSGSYLCTAVVLADTCHVGTSDGAMVVDIGGGDLLDVLGPSGAGHTAWSTIQFGAQGDPDAYDITSGCSELHAAIVAVGSQTLVYDATSTYTAASCGAGMACTVAYEVSCAPSR